MTPAKDRPKLTSAGNPRRKQPLTSATIMNEWDNKRRGVTYALLSNGMIVARPIAC